MEEDTDTDRSAGAAQSPHNSEGLTSRGSFEAFSPSSEASFTATQNAAYFLSDPSLGNRQSGPATNAQNYTSTASSYGIQALFNKVHRSYVNDPEVHPDEGDETANADSEPQPQESEILREWNRKKVLELQERQRESQAKRDQMIEQAALERENFYKERAAQIRARKLLNREKEMVYHAHVESRQKIVEGNLWAAVASLIDLDCEAPPATNTNKVDGKTAVGGTKFVRPKSPPELMSARRLDSKTGKEPPKPLRKTTDLSRMREILLKLQHHQLVRAES